MTLMESADKSNKLLTVSDLHLNKLSGVSCLCFPEAKEEELDETGW